MVVVVVVSLIKSATAGSNCNSTSSGASELCRRRNRPAPVNLAPLFSSIPVLVVGLLGLVVSRDQLLALAVCGVGVVWRSVGGGGGCVVLLLAGPMMSVTLAGVLVVFAGLANC